MLKENLIEIQNMLAMHHRDKADLKILYLNERLENSLLAYNKELESSLNYLRRKNEGTILRRMPNNDDV